MSNPDAKVAVRRLRTGIVPSWEVNRLSVGYDRIRGVVASGMSRVGTGARPMPPLFVRGEWGSGKSHLLAFVRASSNLYDVPSARVDLNARGMPLNYPQRFYRVLVDTLGLDDHVGLRAVLLHYLSSIQARKTIRKFAQTQRAGEIALPLMQLCWLFEQNHLGRIPTAEAWTILLGGDLSWADYPYKRNKALARIGALAGLFAAMGRRGLVITFDEAETIDQLWNIRSRLSAYDVLGRLCEISDLWCIFGITERFDSTIEKDLSRPDGYTSFATPAAKRFLQSWEQVRYEVIEPPKINAATGTQLAEKVELLYLSAYPSPTSPRESVRNCVDEWLRDPARNARRLIRLLIHRLDVQRELR